MRPSTLRRLYLSLALMLAILLLASGCGSDGGTAGYGDFDSSRTSADEVIANPDCTPGDVEGAPILQPDRRIEDIVFHLTGERQTGDLDPVEKTIDDPNFGGVWGDSAGGVVVAVLDCSAVDGDEIARIAGGPDKLHLIEVSHTFRQVNEYRDDLRRKLDSLDIRADLLIDSTLTGRHIIVQLPDAGVLHSGFGSGVPEHLFSIAEGELFVEE
ncbi:MAG: hypothetical protein GY926_02525 [bacterium]|nr:hypothetical protein [bacterium]